MNDVSGTTNNQTNWSGPTMSSRVCLLLAGSVWLSSGTVMTRSRMYRISTRWLLLTSSYQIEGNTQLNKRVILYQIYKHKGRVRLRKSKWNDRFVNDAYEVIMHRCCTSKLCSWKYQILHNGCALKRERWVSYAFFAQIDAFKGFKCIFHHQRTPAPVILLQHINKVGDFSY